MAQRQRRVPVWMKVILTLLAVWTVLSAVCWGLCYMEAQSAAQKGTLPSVGGYSFVAVSDARYGPRYSAGSLIVLDADRDCRVGDTVLWRAPDGQEGALSVVWLEEQADGVFSGISAGEDSASITLQDGEILGVICNVLPVLGAVWEWMLSPAGPVIFGVAPAALCVLWGAVMLHCASRRQMTGGRRTHSRSGVNASGTEPEVFDVFTDPAAPPSDPAVAAAQEPLPPAQEVPSVPAEPATVSEPLEASADELPAGAGPAALPADEPLAPDTGSSNDSAPDTGSPDDGSQVEEVIAIYTGPEDGEQTETWAPSYLNRELSGSLEQLRDALRQAPEQAAAGDTGILSDRDAIELDSRGREVLAQIEAFDPDQVIEEIKRQNALYSQALGLDQMPRQSRRRPDSHSSFIAVMEDGDTAENPEASK